MRKMFGEMSRAEQSGGKILDQAERGSKKSSRKE